MRLVYRKCFINLSSQTKTDIMKRIFSIFFIIAAVTACGPALDGPGGAGDTDIENPGEPGNGEDPGNGENPDVPTPPEEKTFVYQIVDVQPTDWSGDYLLLYRNNGEYIVFNSCEESKGTSTKTLTMEDFVADGIPAETGDPLKTVIEKVGDHYSIFVTDVGYLGLENGSKNSLDFRDTAPTSADGKYLWKLQLENPSDGTCRIENTAFSGKILKWNSSAKIFRCYSSGQALISLYRRNVSDGGTGGGDITDPDNPGGEDPNPKPDPDPEEPDIPGGGDPLPNNAKYGWYELPVMNVAASGNYIVDISDKDLYFAHHLCAGNEKGPNGKTARNYTVCYSAEHHCPVWVAAPRHKMYETKATDRTDAYGKDPQIPSDIQYSSKSVGGGCNKGHMLGSAERTSSSATNRQVFYYTNIAPQLSSTFNTGGGGWNTLEDWVDGQVCSDTLYVVIGTYFKEYKDRRGYSDTPTKIAFGGRTDVTRPTMFYYILLRTKSGSSGKALSKCSSSELKCAAFVRSHETPRGIKVSEQDMMSVADLEKITGFTYFANVPQAPKDSYTPADWGL